MIHLFSISPWAYFIYFINAFKNFKTVYHPFPFILHTHASLLFLSHYYCTAIVDAGHYYSYIYLPLASFYLCAVRPNWGFRYSTYAHLPVCRHYFSTYLSSHLHAHRPRSRLPTATAHIPVFPADHPFFRTTVALPLLMLALSLPTTVPWPAVSSPSISLPLLLPLPLFPPLPFQLHSRTHRFVCSRSSPPMIWSGAQI